MNGIETLGAVIVVSHDVYVVIAWIGGSFFTLFLGLYLFLELKNGKCMYTQKEVEEKYGKK